MSYTPLTMLPTLDQLVQTKQQIELNGERGENRAPLEHCQIKANEDFTAIHTWLNEYSNTLSTYRVYRKEAERLLLWCIYQHKKPFSSLKRDDFEAYILFMQNPQPRNLWCGRQGGRGHTRGGQQWKPFTSPLNATSLKTSITIINSLMTYLVDAGYLQTNPLRLLRKAKQRIYFEERKLEVQARILEEDEWQAMLKTLNDLPEEDPHDKDNKYRLRFIVAMLFYLGLRIGELTSHTWDAFRQIDSHWWFVVKGKGSKWGKIPVNAELFKIATDFRQHLRLNPIPHVDDHTPLVPSWRHTNGLTARHLNHLLKQFANQVSVNYFKGQIHKQAKLKKFSAHWLRHLSATMQDRAGIPFAQIRANHRHENDETTRIYVHLDDKQRHEGMQKLTMQIEVNKRI